MIWGDTMETIMLIAPACIIFFVIAWRAWKTYRGGLLLALIQLGITALAAILSYVLTRWLLNPAKVDFLDLGKKLIDAVPREFFTASPNTAAFLRALPTALMALIAFTTLFEVIRSMGSRIAGKLNRKFHWSEQHLHFRGSGMAALIVGVATAVLCLLVDLVPLNGVVSFSGNMLRCAERATDQAIFTTMADGVEALEESPIKKLTDAMGCRQVFFSLTSARRGDEEFSVGRELLEVSETFVAIMPVFDAVPTQTEVPDAQTLRALPQKIGESHAAMELLSGLVCSSREMLGQSDAVLIFSRLLGVEAETVTKYLSQITADTMQDDLQTVCNIAAMLSDRDLIPAAGEEFDLRALEDQELVAAAWDEVKKNPSMASFFENAE